MTIVQTMICNNNFLADILRVCEINEFNLCDVFSKSLYLKNCRSLLSTVVRWKTTVLKFLRHFQPVHILLTKSLARINKKGFLFE